HSCCQGFNLLLVDPHKSRCSRTAAATLRAFKFQSIAIPELAHICPGGKAARPRRTKLGAKRNYHTLGCTGSNPSSCTESECSGECSPACPKPFPLRARGGPPRPPPLSNR